MDTKRLKKLLLPLVLEQLLAVSVGFIDTFMVSKVGEAAVSGVALVDTINLLVMQVMAAFSAGGIVIISQYIGDRNEEKIGSACKHLELLIYSFSILVMSIFLLFGKRILGVLFGKIEADVMAAAVIYMMITAVSFAFWGLYTSGAAILRCHEDTRTAMKVSIIMNVINVCLNAFFVFVMGWGVMGVAVATLVSRGVAGITMKVILLRFRDRLHGNYRIRNISADMMKRILAMGIPSGIENGMFHVGKLVLTSVIATLGTTAIAANSISYQIIEFPNILGVTIGLALVVIVGQDIGAGEKERAVNDTRYMVRLAYIGDWVCKIILFIVAPVIVSAFSLSDEATRMSVQVLRCFSIAALPIWPLSFTLPNALKGAGDVKYSMVTSVLSMWFGRVIVSYTLIVYFNLGILGVWLGMFVDWYGRGISYLIRYKSGKWLNKRAV